MDNDLFGTSEPEYTLVDLAVCLASVAVFLVWIFVIVAAITFAVIRVGMRLFS